MWGAALEANVKEIDSLNVAILVPRPGDHKPPHLRLGVLLCTENS